jgi:hypothetical protein
VIIISSKKPLLLSLSRQPMQPPIPPIPLQGVVHAVRRSSPMEAILARRAEPPFFAFFFGSLCQVGLDRT